jgi:hypothetical protein
MLMKLIFLTGILLIMSKSYGSNDSINAIVLTDSTIIGRMEDTLHKYLDANKIGTDRWQFIYKKGPYYMIPLISTNDIRSGNELKILRLKRWLRFINTIDNTGWVKTRIR